MKTTHVEHCINVTAIEITDMEEHNSVAILCPDGSFLYIEKTEKGLGIEHIGEDGEAHFSNHIDY